MTLGSAAVRSDDLHVWDGDHWRLASGAELEEWHSFALHMRLSRWAGEINNCAYVRNAAGTYDRWRGIGHEPGTQPITEDP